MSIPENTINSAIAAFRQGADIVEVDVIESTDGDWFCFHDGYEPREFGVEQNIRTMSTEQIQKLTYRWASHDHLPVERLETFLEAFPQKFFNIDRSWWWWPRLLDYLGSLDFRYFTIKSPAEDPWLTRLAEHDAKIPFVPMVRSLEQVELVLSHNINTVGLELLPSGEDHPFLNPNYISGLQDRGLMAFVNAIVLADRKPLYGGFDDEVSVLENPNHGWGRLVAQGADVIQTDWPALMRQYLSQAGHRSMTP